MLQIEYFIYIVIEGMKEYVCKQSWEIFINNI